MSAFDVSAVAREVLKLMRTTDASPAAAPAPEATASARTSRTARKPSQRHMNKAAPQQSAARCQRGLERMFGGWFSASNDKPVNEQIVAQASFCVPEKGVCNVRVFKDGWAALEFPSLSRYRHNAIAVRPEVWSCVMNVMRSTTCSQIHEFLAQHGLRERA